MQQPRRSYLSLCLWGVVAWKGDQHLSTSSDQRTTRGKTPYSRSFGLQTRAVRQFSRYPGSVESLAWYKLSAQMMKLRACPAHLVLRSRTILRIEYQSEQCLLVHSGMFFYRKSADARDSIYALLGMASSYRRTGQSLLNQMHRIPCLPYIWEWQRPIFPSRV